MAEVTTLLDALTTAEVATDAETGLATVSINDATLVPHIFRELDDRGIELTEFTLRKASLDEVFFAITGHGADGEENGSRELEASNR